MRSACGGLYRLAIEPWCDPSPRITARPTAPASSPTLISRRLPRMMLPISIVRMAIVALLTSACPCMAQTPAGVEPVPPPRSVDTGFSELGKGLSLPDPPASLPATPERLDLMRRYMTTAKVDDVAKASGSLIYAQSKAQVSATVASLTVAQKSVAMNAFERAFAGAESRRERRALDDMATYYATRLTDDELMTVVYFYTQGAGHKSLLDPLAMTPDDRQAVGRYVIDHPAMVKFTRVNFAFIRHEVEGRPAATAAFTSDFKMSLCRELNSAHLGSPACRGLKP